MYCALPSLPGAELLITALRDPDEEVCTRAADVLGKLGDPRAIPALVTALDSPDRVRRTAIAALERIAPLDSQRAAVSLTVRLGHANSLVRASAARIFGKLRAPSIDPLLAALRDSEEEVRVAAAEALGALRDQRATPALLAALDGSTRVQATAV